MVVDPQVWHYGLMAQIWAQFLVDTLELAFYQERSQQSGQPVLDLACGTRRLPVPLLRAGIDIDGCDILPDMLALCRQKAMREGLTPRLYEQAMHALDLPRTYKTICICGSFGLAGSREQNLETLRRCYHHLDPSGALVFNIEAECNLPDAWQNWLEEKRRGLSEPRPERGTKRRTPDGTEYVSRFRLVEIDPLEQSYVRQVRLEEWPGEELVAIEECTLRGYTFFRNEVEPRLALASFRDTLVQRDYSEGAATPDHSELVFIAGK